MRKIALHFVLPAVLLCAPIVQAQVLAAGAAGAVAVAPHLAAAVPAVLTGTVSTGSAHVGQAVLAKLASPAALSDGTKLPAGTQLLGKVTQVVSFNRGGGQSSLAMAFDRFKMPGGSERAMGSSVLRSIQGHGSADARTDTAATDVEASSDTQAQARAGARGSSSDGGLLGGVGNTVGGVVNGVGDTVNGVATGATQTVGSLAGVVVNSAGTLTAQGHNVTVPAGTHVTVAASADAATR